MNDKPTMKIELKTIFGDLIIKGNFSSIADAVRAAITAKKSLSSANLRSANLSSANLSSADLSSADLRSANLSSADLSSADLRSADLRSANLRSANLRSANLSSANLSSANLSSANLSSADLSSANLRSADLSSIKHDFWAVLIHAPREVPALRQALIEGRVNGSTYAGECACLVGTIANARQCTVDGLGSLKADANRPAERFFLGIQTGDTPEKNQCAKLAVEWLDEWQQLIGCANATADKGA